MQVFFVDLEDLRPPLPALPVPSWRRSIGGTFGMVGRGLPHALPRRRPRVLASAA